MHVYDAICAIVGPASSSNSTSGRCGERAGAGVPYSRVCRSMRGSLFDSQNKKPRRSHFGAEVLKEKHEPSGTADVLPDSNNEAVVWIRRFHRSSDRPILKTRPAMSNAG